ncbi:S8 family serine peptidase [Candidatus Falkowbacteria bacterium]|nr:S8 family serine peptidase [Candidatus Falkowbacteria bacterium]
MNRIKFLTTLIILGLVFIESGLFFYRPILARQDISSEFRNEEILVKFKKSSEIFKVKITGDSNVLETINRYQKNSEIEYIEPNYTLQAAAFPSDPDYRLQSYLNVIKAREAWSKELLVREQESLDRKSVIAILDTGVDLDHPDLKDKIWVNSDEPAGNGRDDDGNGFVDDVNGWDFINNDPDPNPDFSPGYIEDAIKHGTIVAGVAAAASNNAQGISGLSWFSQVMPLRVLDSKGSGDVFSVVRAIDYAIGNGADIINMSFIGTGFSQSLFNAIERANQNNVLVVAAAGNTDPKVNGVNLDISKSYPVCYDGPSGQNLVIGVASLDGNLVKSGFSNFGSCIDLVAPGEAFYSAQVYQENASGFTKFYDGYWSGTSLSAPLVSGTLGILKAIRPGFSAEDFKNFITDSARDISGQNPNYIGKLGAGLLDVSAALDAALGRKEPASSSGKSNYIIAGLGYGSFPQLKILERDGSVFKAFYAYSPFFGGAINVAAGDVNGDGKDEIITGAGDGGGPHVRIFNTEGQVLSQFFAYDKNFRGGVNIAAGDVTGDGVPEIITGPGKGGAPEVKVFDFEGNLIYRFFAYGEGFLGGVNIASGDINSDGRADIITGAGAGGGPHVRIFHGNGQLISQFFAYNQNFKGGVNVAAGDVSGDGVVEVIASIEKDSVPTVRVFNYLGFVLDSFFAYEPNFLNGVFVAAGDIDNDGISEIITGPAKGGQAQVRIFDKNGKIKDEFLAHGENYFGGVRPYMIRY